MGYNIGYVNSQDASITNPPIEQGSTFELPFTITLPAAIMSKFTVSENINGALSAGFGIRAQYRTTLNAATGIDFTCTATKQSSQILNCLVVLGSDQTTNLTAGCGFWDCELYNNDYTPPYVFKPFGAGNKAKVVGEATKEVI